MATHFTSFGKAQDAIQSGATSCQAIVEYYLAQIKATADLNIYVEVFEEEALEYAKSLDLKFQQSPDNMGRLFGMVLSIKDVICYKDHQVTAGSKILEGFHSLFTAPAIQQLLDEDAIIIGRVNCDEFAMGSTNETSIYGPTKNAFDQERIPGGSSGASAVSVQADTCLVAIGSDTGGSVRQPAAFCGLVGMKPTYGRVSRYGLIAYGSSFDQLGVIANCTEDVALVLEIMAGADPMDSTCSTKPVPAYSQGLADGGAKTITYFPSALSHPSLDKEISAKSQQLLEQLEAAGHQLVAAEFPLLEYMIPAYYVLTTAEASSNLSRFDGVRYGYRAADVKNLEQTYRASRTAGFGSEVKRRIMLGTFVLSAGYYDAYYAKAQKIRRLIKDQTDQIFQQADFIIMPTAPSTAWKLGDTKDDPVAMYLADIYTVQANMCGIPAISLPLGKHSNGMPYGIQFFAPKFHEDKLLAFAHQVEEKLITSNSVY